MVGYLCAHNEVEVNKLVDLFFRDSWWSLGEQLEVGQGWADHNSEIILAFDRSGDFVASFVSDLDYLLSATDARVLLYAMNSIYASS